MHRDFYTVIPAGGAGTRLWPLSRANRPKFLLPLLDGKSLLQLTADRVAPFSPPDHIFVVAGKAHVATIARQLPEVPESNLVVESAPRGTGSAIALAAMLIARRDPTAIMGSFAADHRIGNLPAFHEALATAIAVAGAGSLTTIGIEPDRPETGYGYIERTDDRIPAGGYVARRFVEKPDAATAEQFLASGRYLWNASMFVWRVDVFQRAFAQAQPELFEALERIAACWDDPAAGEAMERAWLELPVTTIDHGLMEHVDEFVVVPADMDWSDIGDWNGFGKLIAADVDENCLHGDVIAEGAARCLVWSETKRPIALVGVDNLAVIDLDDVLLVVNRERSQDVRAVVAKIERDHPDLT